MEEAKPGRRLLPEQLLGLPSGPGLRLPVLHPDLETEDAPSAVCSGSALSASLSAKTRLQPRQPRCPQSAPPHGDAELLPRKPGHLHFPSVATRSVPEPEMGVPVRHQVWREQSGPGTSGEDGEGRRSKLGLRSRPGASERESGRSGQPRRARPPRSHSRGPPGRTGAGTCGVVLQGTCGKGQQRRHSVEES
ncbi:uncharacterized protein LOC116570952 isoform X2 [Mustela erminea]|uniref:uncharacterized protein LOC116570952 isoform X2 n=1 Tax=Mustela erminea TaxID=36723 RepID=UPI0013875A7C|nr:uncharacterized protein LOC116570952 isoform X2 [Mustela erminea]